MLCEAAAYYKAQGKTLWDVLEELYRTHGYILDDVTAVILTGADGAKKMQEMMKALREAPPMSVGGIAVARVEDYLTPEMQSQGFGKSDTLRFVMADGSFVAVRPSGTEPKCKYYYCVCGREKSDAARKLALLREAFGHK